MKYFSRDIVYLDDREPIKVKKAFKDYFETKQIPVKITRMDVADIYYNNILIERKDCIDFLSSWKDSRLQNQRYKMLLEQQKKTVHPYVIIQGTFYDAQSQLIKNKLAPNLKYTYKQWLGGIASLNEIGINTIQLTNRINHNNLAYLTELLAKHCNEDKKIHEVFIEPDGQTWDIKAYQCIPGVGYSKAIAIAKHMSIQDLLRRPRDKAIEGLVQINGIGEKLARTIYETVNKKEKLTPLREL